MKRFKRTIILCALVLGAVCMAPAQVATIPTAPARPPAAATDNDIARWLAGLPPTGDGLRAFALVPAWREHAEELARAWAQNERERMMKVRQWAPAALGAVSTSDSPVFYFFSGADFLYPHALFPNARAYVMCAREPVGSQPDPTRIDPPELPAALATLRKSLGTLLDFSYSITTDLRSDVGQRHIPGILPVLELILAREGCQVIEVLPVRCDSGGTLSTGTKGKGGSPGVRIRFQRAGQTEQALYYFYGDISNEGLKTHGGVLRFCESLGRGRSMLKAASFLPHEGGFTRINAWILANSSAVMQDTSGIPYGELRRAGCTVRFWGRNAEPIAMFQKHTEPDLMAAVNAASPPRIPFGFGYQYDPAKALLIVAERADAR